MAIFLALVSHIGWGIGDVFCVVATRTIGTLRMTVWRGIFAFAGATVFLLPFFWRDFFALTPSLLALIFLLSIITLIADFAFFESLKVGNPTVVGVISASFVAISVVISFLFLGEHVTVEKAIVTGMIIAGVILCMFDKTTFSMQWGRGEMMAVIAMVGWGVYYACIKIPIRTVGWFVPGYLFLLFFPAIALAVRFRGHTLQSPFSRTVFPPFFASVLLTSLAEWLYNISIQTRDVSFVAPIAGSYPALFVLVSHMIFREPTKSTQWLGIGMTVAGIIFLAAVE